MPPGQTERSPTGAGFLVNPPPCVGVPRIASPTDDIGEALDMTTPHTPARRRQQALRRAVPDAGAATTADTLTELGTPLHVERGETVLSAGEEVDAVHLVRAGEVRLRLSNQRVRLATVAVIRPGGIVGDIPLFSGHRMAYDAVAAEDSVLIRIPRRDFLALLQREPKRSIQWLHTVACRMEQVQRHVLMLVTKDLEEQIASLLLDARVRQPDGSYVVTLAHRDIADLLGASRPAVSRALSRLREDGLIDTGYASVILRDPDRLTDRAGPSVGPAPCVKEGRARPFVG
jgi:CRP-like cAMP-binding protein